MELASVEKVAMPTIDSSYETSICEITSEHFQLWIHDKLVSGVIAREDKRGKMVKNISTKNS